jgi:hypothetical protein
VDSWSFLAVIFFDFGILGFWDFGILGFWDFGILGFWDFGILGFWESVNSGETVNPEDTPLLTFPRFPRFHEPTVTSLFTKGKVIRRMKRLV